MKTKIILTLLCLALCSCGSIEISPDHIRAGSEAAAKIIPLFIEK